MPKVLLLLLIAVTSGCRGTPVRQPADGAPREALPEETVRDARDTTRILMRDKPTELSALRRRCDSSGDRMAVPLADSAHIPSMPRAALPPSDIPPMPNACPDAKRKDVTGTGKEKSVASEERPVRKR